MSRKLLITFYVLAIALAYWRHRGDQALVFGKSNSAAEVATRIFKTLTPEQKGKAVVPYGDPDRDKILFPHAPHYQRPGIDIKSMTKEQRDLVAELIRAATTPYGAEKILTIMDQPRGGYPNYLLAFYGDPTKDKHFQWRLSGHHMTLFGSDCPESEPRVGPLLLGADPPILWPEDEKVSIELYNSLTQEQRAKAVAPKGQRAQGIRIGELKPEQKKLVEQLIELRLKVYPQETSQRTRKVIQAHGGLDALVLSFEGEATRPCKDGGRYSWYVRGDNFLCDLTIPVDHIHMTLVGGLPDRRLQY